MSGRIVAKAATVLNRHSPMLQGSRAESTEIAILKWMSSIYPLTRVFDKKMTGGVIWLIAYKFACAKVKSHGPVVGYNTRL